MGWTHAMSGPLCLPCEQELEAWTSHGFQPSLEAEVRWVGQGGLRFPTASLPPQDLRLIDPLGSVTLDLGKGSLRLTH